MPNANDSTSAIPRREAISRLGVAALGLGAPISFARTSQQQPADEDFERIRPIREYLPLPNPDDPRAPAITARRLLSHSGGWRNWRNNATQALTSDFDPGTRWSYSGEGFFFMQRVAEKLTGKGMSLLARERVFKPLGMKRSSMVALAELEPYQAAGHSGRGEVVPPFGRPTLLELRRMMTEHGVPLDNVKTEDSEQAIKTAEPMLPLLSNYLIPNAAARMLTTANDFGTFLRHLVTAKRKGGSAAAIVEQMMSPQIRCNEAVQWGLVFTNGDRGARVYERVIRAMTGEDHPAFLWA